MSVNDPLTGVKVAISISESPDIAVLGLSAEHLRDAMIEAARHLLAMGAHLIYGGDLRPGGFTELLFELVARHQKSADDEVIRPAVTNYLAWPVHIGRDRVDLALWEDGLRPEGELVYLDPAGTPLSSIVRLDGIQARSPEETEWAPGLTAMRQRMTEVADARIVLGGRTRDYKGSMPGIAEEALLTLEAGKPLYLLGGFGGCARDIAHELHLITEETGGAWWPGREQFKGYGPSNLQNGLTPPENETLASTIHVDQAVMLTLRGMLRLLEGETNASHMASEA